MLASIFGFSRTPIACKWKFNAIYKQYKDDKIISKISSNDCYECPFYDALDSWVASKWKCDETSEHFY
jgi:hypothetical protein